MPGMKLQFSLATLLVCTALIAVATTASLRVPVSRIISQHEDMRQNLRSFEVLFTKFKPQERLT